MLDDVTFERHYRATRDLELVLTAARREHNDGGHLQGEARPGEGRGDQFNQPPGTVLKLAAGQKVRLTEGEAAPYLEVGGLEPAP
jgi:hypothetical protein